MNYNEYVLFNRFLLMIMERRHRTMDLLQLKYFSAVARFEHITKAAEYLHIAQPSVSQMISRL